MMKLKTSMRYYKKTFQGILTLTATVAANSVVAIRTY